ncbi:GNAT family N-acetyltransferase [Natronorubrum sp. A-ect3]|uniref:GNAT family N-acetyltransferase n=1 Tax=Natronorubrum sp. A-ect3 TaxID=3242698 RepID=UPI00359E42FD
MSRKITELTEPSEWQAAFPVLQELRSHLTEESFLDHLDSMWSDGYRLFATIEDDELVAVAGVIVHTNFYYHQHAFLYDLVTTESRQSEGIGAELLAHVESWAREQGCETIVLESGLWRSDAHRFYEDRMDYEKYTYTFKKSLTADDRSTEDG